MQVRFSLREEQWQWHWATRFSLSAQSPLVFPTTPRAGMGRGNLPIHQCHNCCSRLSLAHMQASGAKKGTLLTPGTVDSATAAGGGKGGEGNMPLSRKRSGGILSCSGDLNSPNWSSHGEVCLPQWGRSEAGSRGYSHPCNTSHCYRTPLCTQIYFWLHRNCHAAITSPFGPILCQEE